VLGGSRFGIFLDGLPETSNFSCPPGRAGGAPADARAGGLLSFNAKIADEFNRAASYVDRILRGAKPADLPVQFPVKFEMVLNAKTAMAAGITFPETLKAIADEVIE
jgi:ABC-type uncharacterized transport system substrate-binding protein